MARRPRLAAARWQELIERQRGSGLGVEAFCRRHRVAVSTFFAWRRRLEQTAASMFVEAIPPARQDAPASPIEMVLAGGARLQVRAGFDAALLRQVVEALQ